ncbi:hypothetical protein CFOL_v3_22861 [Cephalotus follicularis]|uniref:Uncharacterized protein n=1 Tax=Cephalotus follicularis TaxID=3775 RepID=A0A1Q3CGL2_CEPFO|nr:hypothetical protein CFOL_v3_22861 [Cephalotus follicularis]
MNLEIIKGFNNGKAYEDMMKKNPKFWCKAYFSTILRYDIIDNNLDKIFNGWILNARTKAIVTMLEQMRVAIMRRTYEKKVAAEKWSGDIAQRALKKLNDNKRITDTCSLDPY